MVALVDGNMDLSLRSNSWFSFDPYPTLELAVLRKRGSQELLEVVHSSRFEWSLKQPAAHAQARAQACTEAVVKRGCAWL